MYMYPKSIREFKDKDIYQIKHHVVDIWNNGHTYSIGDCYGRKNYIKFLIAENRIRIKKDD